MRWLRFVYATVGVVPRSLEAIGEVEHFEEHRYPRDDTQDCHDAQPEAPFFHPQWGLGFDIGVYRRFFGQWGFGKNRVPMMFAKNKMLLMSKSTPPMTDAFKYGTASSLM